MSDCELKSNEIRLNHNLTKYLFLLAVTFDIIHDIFNKTIKIIIKRDIFS